MSWHPVECPTRATACFFFFFSIALALARIRSTTRSSSSASLSRSETPNPRYALDSVGWHSRQRFSSNAAARAGR